MAKRHKNENAARSFYEEQETPSGHKGTIAELYVANDLLIKGYEVFKALAPHCSCDLIAQRGGRFWRIEVKTTYRSGPLQKLSIPKGLDKAAFDILALFVADTEINYLGVEEL